MTIFNKVRIITFFLLFFSMLPINTVKAQTPPYNNVTLKMYELSSADGAIINPQNPCRVSPLETRYGCTADSNRSYPFPSNPYSLGMENALLNNTQQGYLHNLVPTEIAMTVVSRPGEPKPLACVKAQAIAARTYAYYQIFDGEVMTNSASHQVYIPYRYDQLNTAQKQRVNEAVQDVFYMTQPNNTDPIISFFGADNDDTTTANSNNVAYLISVYDPISHLGTDEGTFNGGMSSRGACRWAYGHTSSRGPVVPDHPNYPHDNYNDANNPNGVGDFWSV